MSVCNGVYIICSVVPFLACLSAILLAFSPTREGTHWNDCYLESLEVFEGLFYVIFFDFG